MTTLPIGPAVREYAQTYPERHPSPSQGTGNSQAKLNSDKVYAIRKAADAGAKLAELADAFSISVRACRHIARRTSWTHLPELGGAR
ncbi:hypothetical protein [Kitasatospora purpeofusca]|uniref:hypothetical protein n=1 Tax=Kitasatospora purpeofusca TaxID=67352 RepID=UPI0036C7A974